MLKKQHVRDETAKSDILSALSQKDCALLFSYEEPPFEYLEKTGVKVEKIREDGYVVHPPYSHEALTRWLYLGNWQAIHPVQPEFIGIDTFRKSVQDVERQMRQYGVTVLIDSFHDDTDWNVFSLDADNATQC